MSVTVGGMTSKDEDEIEVIPGVVGPRTFECDNWTVGSGHAVRFRVRWDEARRVYGCTDIWVGDDGSVAPPPGDVTSEVLREIPVAVMTRTVLLLKVSDGGPPQYLRDLPNPGSREPWGRQLPEGLKAEGPTDRVLRWVAHWYRLAIALGDNAPTKAVQEALGLSRTTSIRWVMSAREKGFLGPAEPGKRGESITDGKS